jgi:hypothetical protein
MLLFVLSRLTNMLVLVNNLRVHIKPMFQLYCVLKDCEVPPSIDKIAIASGVKKLDAATEAEYLRTLQGISESPLKISKPGHM